MSPPAAGAAATSGDGPPPSPRELYTIPASSGKNFLSLDAPFFPVVLLLGLQG